MGKEALSIGANTFQFFTRNPRGGSAKEILKSDVDAFLDYSDVNNISNIFVYVNRYKNKCFYWFFNIFVKKLHI